MSSSSSSSSGGIGFGGALTLLFIGLKLTNQIDWSWWWVLSPIWIILAVILVVMAIAGITLLIMAGWKTYKQRKAWAKKSKKGVE